MISFALLLAFSLSIRENETRICVCYDSCPKICEVFDKIYYFYTPDLDTEFTKRKTTYMDIRFAHAPSPFTFDMGTFDGVEVQFDSFHLAPKAHIKVLVTRSTTAEPSFNNLDVTFAGYSNSQVLDIRAIKMNEVDSRIDNIAPKLITQSFEASNSVYDFTEITIKKDCSDPALVIDILKGYQLDLTIGKNIIKFDSSTFYFEGKASVTISTALTDVKLTVTGTATESMPYLLLIGFPYTTFRGTYPDDYIIQMQNLQVNTVIAEEKRLPISLDGARVNLYVSQPTTIIEGDTSCDLGLYTKAEPAQRYAVTIVKLNGKIDLYSSWFDVFMVIFNPSLAGWEAPWTPCVGKGGVSTIYINKTLYVGSSPVSAFKYHCDFNRYLDDESLKTLLSKNHSVLYFNTNNTVFTTEHVSIIPVDNLDVPGFSSISNCVNISIAKMYPFEITLSAISPTTFPIKLCYANSLSDCKVDVDGFLITDYSISSLSKNCIYPGIKDVTLTLKKDLDILDFSTLEPTQTGLKIEIKSPTNSKHMSLKNIDNLKPSQITSLKLTRLNIENGNIDVGSVQLKECNYTGAKSNSFQFGDATKVVVDDLFLQNLARHVQNSIHDFTLNITSYNRISADDTYIKFDNKATGIETGLVPVNTITSLTVYTTGILYLKFDVISKEFKIVHSFAPNLFKHQLIIEGLPATSDKKITYDHSSNDVEIVRRDKFNVSPLTIEGTGEVSYINDYADADSDTIKYCVCESNCAPCNEYDVPTDHIVKGDDFVRVYQNQDKKNVKVYVTQDIPEIAHRYFTTKYTEFIGIVQTKPTLTIGLTTSLTEEEYSTVHFTNLKISYTGSPPNNIVPWGEVRFTDCEVSDVAYAVTCTNYAGPYSSIEKFVSLTVKGYLELDGAAAGSIKYTVAFQDEKIHRRLRLNVPMGAVVSVGGDQIKLNEYLFPLKHTAFVDVEITAPQATSFTFKPLDNNINNYPIIRCQSLKLASVTFTGEWPSITAGTSKISFVNTQFGFNLTLDSETIPASFNDIQMDFRIIANKPSSTITGPFNVVSERYHLMTFESSAGTKNATINLAGGLGIDYKTWIKLNNPVNLKVKNVYLTSTSRAVGYISFQHYVSLTGTSFVTITDAFKNIEYYDYFELNGADITDELDTKPVTDFLGKPSYVQKIHPNDVNKFGKTKPVEFVSPEPLTHGFVGYNFQAEINTDGYISVKNILPPSDTPFEACYGKGVSCKNILTEESFANFAGLLPNNIKSIVLTFSENNVAALNLDNQKINNVKVTFKPQTFVSSKFLAPKVALGKDRVSVLSLINIDLDISGSFSAGHAYFTNAGVNSVEGFTNITADFDSWHHKSYTAFSGLLTIIYPSTSVRFNVDGWTLDDTKFSSEGFPNFAINCTTTDSIYLTVDDHITAVKSAHVYTRTHTFEVGKYWNAITSPSEIKLISSVPLTSVVVESQCYPFTVLPLVNGTTVKFAKNTPLPIQVDRLTLNDQQFTIDFNLVEDTNDSRLKVENGISLSGKSKVYFPNSHNTSFPCISNEITVQDGSNSIASDVKVNGRLALYGNSKLSSSVDISDATVEFHWWGNRLPKLIAQIEQFPKAVKVIFDGEKNDGTSQKFIKGKKVQISLIGPRCNRWLENVKYESKVGVYNGDDKATKLICEDGFLTLSGPGRFTELSVGAIAGIAIACVVIVAVVVFLIVYCVCCKGSSGKRSSTLLSLGTER